MSKVQEVLEEKNGAWYVVFGDGETFSELGECSVMCLTEQGKDNLFAGRKSWHLQETDELIKEIDISHLLEFYTEAYGSGFWEDEDE